VTSEEQAISDQLSAIGLMEVTRDPWKSIFKAALKEV
jgi:hypothetical protein